MEYQIISVISVKANDFLCIQISNIEEYNNSKSQLLYVKYRLPEQISSLTRFVVIICLALISNWMKVNYSYNQNVDAKHLYLRREWYINTYVKH